MTEAATVPPVTEETTPAPAPAETAQAAPEQEDETTLLNKKATEAPGVPEKYEVKLPEGMELDAGMLDKFTPVFKELKLPQEAVQKLAEAYAPMVKEMAEAQMKQGVDGFKQIVREWKDETIQKLGGDYEKKVAAAATAIDKFGSPELRKLFDDTGVGNNYEMVNFLIKVGQAISPDSFPGGSTAPSGPTLDVLYPTMKK